MVKDKCNKIVTVPCQNQTVQGFSGVSKTGKCDTKKLKIKNLFKRQEI